MTPDAQNAVLLAINRIFHEALACETEEQLGRVCLAAAEELTQSRFGFVGESNAQGLLDAIAISDPGWKACRMEGPAGHGKVHTGFRIHGIYGRVIRDGKGLYTNDPASHPDSVGAPKGHPRLTAFLGAPLVYAGEVIGMVGLANRENGYRDEDLEALEALAPAIVQALMRKRADEAVRESERHLALIVDSIADGFFALARDWRFTRVNDAALRHFQKTRDELHGRTLWEVFPTAVGSLFETEYRRAMESGRPSHFETASIISDRAMEVHAYPGPETLAVLFRDVTERKQTEQSLCEALDRAAWLARLPGENPNPVMRVSAQGIVLYRNPAAALAVDWACQTGGPPPPALLPLIEQATTRGQPVQQDVLLGGRSYSVSVAPFPDEQYANVYVNDISERVEAERALREARDQLEVRVKERTAELDQAIRWLEDENAERKRVEDTVRAERQRLYDVLETLPAYVVLLAADYHVPFANRFFRERFGESHGRCCFEYLFERSEPCENCESYKALWNNSPHRWEWTGPDGRDYDIYDFPFKDTDGSPLIMEMGIDITERKRAEAELRRHQEQLEALVKERTSELELRHAQLQAVLDHLTEGLVIADLDGNLFHWNPAAVAIHGFASMDEGRRRLPEFAEIFELSTAEDGILPIDRWPLARILRGETLRGWEVTIRRHDSDWQRVFSYGGTLARDASGSPLLAVVSVTDVTERKRADLALRESREDLNRAQAVAHTGSWRLDVRRNELVWSDETYRMFGIPKDTPLTYEAFLGCIHPDDREHVDRKWTAALKGEPYDVEHRIVIGDAVKWVRERAEMDFDPDGTLRAGFGTVQDVTERKQAEAALQQANETLEQRVRERTEELLQVNQTLRMISECNQALVRATTEEELVHEICRVILRHGRYRLAWVGYAEHDARKTVRPVAWVGVEQGYLDKARITWADEERGRGPTGTCIRTGKTCMGRDFHSDPELSPWREQALARGFRSSIALPLIAEGRAFGALTIYASDVGVFGEEQTILLSELADDLAFGILARRAAGERDHARQVAEERARQLGTLATELGRVEQRERQRLARLLHDHLQQLLVGAKYNLASLEGKLRTKAKQQAARQVTAILDEAITAASTLTAELSPPALHEKGLVAGLEWLGRQMRQKYGLKMALRTQPGAEPASEQVRFLLFEAVRELLFNVVKHAKVNRARVDLARMGDAEVRVVVADGGAGFEPKRLEGVEHGSGGFGLFSIRERLSCLGGRMTAESSPGRGSRFTLVAPALLLPGAADAPASGIAPAAARQAAVAANGSARVATPRIRVLLADDHAVMRDGLARLLSEQPDLEVVGQASDGQTAIDLARELRPDVVLMDVSMPRVNGVDATVRLMSEDATLRIIGLSMHENAGMPEAMLGAGAVAYLTKSGPPARVIAAIRACMASDKRATPAKGGRRGGPVEPRRRVAAPSRRRTSRRPKKP